MRTGEQTWDVIEPLLQRYGVTRVCDITGLDCLGLPVAMAVRPETWTLSVSQGKGQSLNLAKVSAAMEAVELWHAERHPPPTVAAGVPQVELDTAPHVDDFAVRKGPFVTDRTPMDWVSATSLVSGREILVPRDVVMFASPDRFAWTGVDLRANSNGLASGNTREEALVHAMYEVIERHAIARSELFEMTKADRVDPETIPDEVCRSLIDAVLASGGDVAIAQIENELDIPTYWAVIWSWDFPIPCGGYGAHSDSLIAVSRALTEAAQSRLTVIAGSRDDLEDFYGYMRTTPPKLRARSYFGPPTCDFTAVTRADICVPDMGLEAQLLARHIHTTLGSEPVFVDPSSDPDFAVVKVVVPAGQFDGARVHVELERVS